MYRCCLIHHTQSMLSTLFICLSVKDKSSSHRVVSTCSKVLKTAYRACQSLYNKQTLHKESETFCLSHLLVFILYFIHSFVFSVFYHRFFFLFSFHNRWKLAAGEYQQSLYLSALLYINNLSTLLFTHCLRRLSPPRWRVYDVIMNMTSIQSYFKLTLMPHKTWPTSWLLLQKLHFAISCRYREVSHDKIHKQNKPVADLWSPACRRCLPWTADWLELEGKGHRKHSPVFDRIYIYTQQLYFNGHYAISQLQRKVLEAEEITADVGMRSAWLVWS